MRQERGDGQIVWIAALVLIVGAIAATGYVLTTGAETRHAQEAIGTIDQARDAQAESDLRTAIQVAQEYFAENGTYAGFGPEAAAGMEPSIAYNASPVAVAGQVSIRGVGPTTVVMATKGGSGALCAGANGGIVSYGRVDATSAGACTGGW